MDKIEVVQEWFLRSVTYEGEPYTIDAEQAAAVMDDGLNTIVVARAGSGKTRTIVAKIVYLIAKCGVKPEEIMSFVFNANAAAEINARLDKMRIDGEPLVKSSMSEVEETERNDVVNSRRLRIATTFHAFARKIVYDVCGGREKCGKILAGEKEDFVREIVKRMMREEKWFEKIAWFTENGAEPKEEQKDKQGILDDKKLDRFAKMMTQFVNRAQQKYLGGADRLRIVAEGYLRNAEIDARERIFVELGVECSRRYHWYLLDARKKLPGFEEYGTDFNLIVSWASKLITARRGNVRQLLANKKYILIDEYQDFSQLFLAAIEAVRTVAENANVFVVGDDWQAINRFAGSEVEYFKEFERYFAKDYRRYEITTNYRCDYMVVNTARKFMKKAMGEKGKFRAKSRRSGKVTITDPRETECEIVLGYGGRHRGMLLTGVKCRDEIYLSVARRIVGREPELATVRYIKTLINILRKNYRRKDILLLHRNNEMNLENITLARLSNGLRMALTELGVMTMDEYDMRVRVMTIHRSKGLEAEMVIILEADEGIIPRTHADTRLYGVFGETESVALDDQKRLFYVAMTRAKNRLYIIHDGSRGKGFVKYLGRNV